MLHCTELNCCMSVDSYAVFVIHQVVTLNTSWKVMEFKKGIFQALEVMENDCGHGKS